MLVSVLYVLVGRLLELIVLVARGDRGKDLEILVLRHELSILRRQAGQPRFEPHDRLLFAALSRLLPRRNWNVFPVRPETLLRWHRRLVARRWRYQQRRPGRPAIRREVCELVLRLARENPSWGYQRIVGELRKLSIAVSATSVRNILAKADLPPAPGRDRHSWRAFLRAHGESILACDFFTVDTVWLRRIYMLVFLCRPPPDRVPRVHQQAERPLGAAAGAQPADGARRPRAAGAVSDPRPRREVPARLRRALSGREHQGHPHSRAGAERERPYGALDRQRPPRVPRSAADHRPPPARARSPRLRPALQPWAAAPRSRPDTARRRSLIRPGRLGATTSSGNPGATCLAPSSTSTTSPPPRDDRVSAPYGISAPRGLRCGPRTMSCPAGRCPRRSTDVGLVPIHAACALLIPLGPSCAAGWNGARTPRPSPTLTRGRQRSGSRIPPPYLA